MQHVLCFQCKTTCNTEIQCVTAYVATLKTMQCKLTPDFTDVITSLKKAFSKKKKKISILSTWKLFLKRLLGEPCMHAQ